jgi:hypothetical protein
MRRRITHGKPDQLLEEGMIAAAAHGHKKEGHKLTQRLVAKQKVGKKVGRSQLRPSQNLWPY